MKKFKELVKLCVLVMLVVAMTGCKKEAKEEKTSLYDAGLKAIKNASAVMHSDEYMDLMRYNFTEEFRTEAVLNEKYTKPVVVYKITYKADSLGKLLDFLDDGNIDDLPKDIQMNLKRSISSTVISVRNGEMGSKALSFASVCTGGYMFANDEIEEECIAYLYIFSEGSYPMLVSYFFGDDGAISASASPVMDTELVKDDEDAVLKKFLGTYASVIDADIKKVK